MDARYEKVRVAGQIRDVAILIAGGIGTAGKRLISGVSVSLSEPGGQAAYASDQDLSE